MARAVLSCAVACADRRYGRSRRPAREDAAAAALIPPTPMKIELPVMTKPQEQAWLGLITITRSARVRMVSGRSQMVHLLCAERGVTPNRPTDDGDAVLDVRARPAILNEFTSVLRTLGFVSAGESMERASSTAGSTTRRRSTSSSPDTSVSAQPAARCERRHDAGDSRGSTGSGSCRADRGVRPGTRRSYSSPEHGRRSGHQSGGLREHPRQLPRASPHRLSRYSRH